MSPKPIDPKEVLKKLFEKGQSSEETQPNALFRAASGPDSQTPQISKKPGETEPAKEALSVFKRLLALGNLLNPVKGIFQRLLKTGDRKQVMIGLDMGSSSVKVLRIERADNQVRVTGIGIEELPAGASEGPEWDKAAREAVQRLQKQGLINGPVVVGFYHSDIMIESVRIPKMPLSEVGQAVIWEARDRFNFDPDQSVVRHLITGEHTVDNEPQFNILLVTAPKQNLMAQWRLLNNLGMQVVAFEPVSLSSFYSLSGLNLWRDEEWVALLEMGLRTSHLSFVRGKVVHFARSFQISGESLTRSIADYCQVESAEAERMKREHGISWMALEEDRHQEGHETGEKVRVSHALGLHLERLVAEIEQSFRYFFYEQSGLGTDHIDRLVITGGGGLLNHLSEFLAHRFSVPVSTAEPFGQIEIDPQYRDALQNGWAQRLVVPMGLALRSSGKNGKKWTG